MSASISASSAGLAERALQSAAGDNHFIVAPSVDLAVLTEIWRGVLRKADITPATHFFEAGGHALHAMEMLAALRVETGIDAPLGSVYELPTLAGFHSFLMSRSHHLGLRSVLPRNVVRLSPTSAGSGAPKVFCLHSGHYCWALAQRLDTDATLYAVAAEIFTDFVVGRSDIMPASIEALARAQVATIRTVQPRGPYCLFGFSLGGRVALEAARLLRGDGEDVPLLAIADTALAGSLRRQRLSWLRRHLRRVGVDGPAYLLQAWRTRQERHGRRQPPGLDNSRSRHAERDAYLRVDLRNRHDPASYDGPVVLFQTINDPDGYESDPGLGWPRIVSDRLEVHRVPGEHMTILKPPNVETVALVLRRHLGRLARADT